MFEGQLDIIKSGIVSHRYDAFWDDVTSIIGGLNPKDVLICTLPFEAGGIEDMLLQKMLQVCTLTPDQYNILAINQEQLVPLSGLQSALLPKYILLFGIMPQQLGIHALFHINEPNRFNGCVFVPTLGLMDIEQQPEAKKQLWLNGLKPVFVDKTFQVA